MKGSKKRKQKGAIFRLATAAIALSISSVGINNRNCILLNDAQGVWEFNKSLGLGYDGDEGEVESRIAQLEEMDNEIFHNVG